MNGWKTWTALAIYTSGQIIKLLYPDTAEIVDDVVYTVAVPLGAYGIGSKIDRSRGVIPRGGV